MQKQGPLGELFYLTENIVLFFSLLIIQDSDLFKMASIQLIKLVVNPSLLSTARTKE